MRGHNLAPALAGIIAAAVAGSFMWASHLEGQLHPLATASPFELWLHRAGDAQFARPGVPLTPARLDSIVAHGYTGVEFDVRWRADRGLVVAHDVAASAEAPLLRDMLARRGAALSYWLDFKGLTPGIAHAAAEPLAQMIARLDLASLVFVEAVDIDALAILCQRSYRLRSIARLTSARGLRASPWYLLALGDIVEHRVDGVSIEYRRLDAGLAQALAPLRIFAYTCNDAVAIPSLRALGVDVLLTDRLAPEP